MRPGEDVGRRHLGRRADAVEERPDHPGIALDRSPGARAPFFFSKEGDDRLLPGGDVDTKLGREKLRVHRRHLGE
jgi:hypothetical protein